MTSSIVPSKKPRARLPSALKVLNVFSMDPCCPPESAGLERGGEKREAGAGIWHALSGLTLGSSLFTA